MWIIFDPTDRTNRAPDFSLPLYSGGSVSLSNYYGRNILTLYFPGKTAPGHMEGLISALANWVKSDPPYPAELLLVVPRVWDLTGAAQPEIPASLKIAIDPIESVRGKYLGMFDGLAVDVEYDLSFILDEYGCPYAAWTGRAVDWPALRIEFSRWIDYIEIQCPE